MTVLEENISVGNANNFYKLDTDQVDISFPYDYDSVMHYGMYQFSKNDQPTIIPKDPQVVIGQRKYISKTDVAEIRAKYNCK